MTSEENYFLSSTHWLENAGLMYKLLEGIVSLPNLEVSFLRLVNKKLDEYPLNYYEKASPTVDAITSQVTKKYGATLEDYDYSITEAYKEDQ